ncbi:MAG: hypothetical protein ISR69_11180 [Gammaproteobacteria bacterium]|nr:hypothetical protein [Gammaproteobacteria bacterium]
MQTHSISPLRKLVQSHSEGLISKQDYREIRTMLLDKLERQGDISDIDIDNFYTFKRLAPEVESKRTYSNSDLFIIILGLAASAALAYVLYS